MKNKKELQKEVDTQVQKLKELNIAILRAKDLLKREQDSLSKAIMEFRDERESLKIEIMLLKEEKENLTK